jgi:hypothetical protein
MSRARLIVVAALCALLALPATASAAELVDVTGTVVSQDTTPAAGVEVLVRVVGSDIVQPVTTGDDGSFAVQVLAAVGDTLEVRATGATVRTGPDEEGCTRSSTPFGAVSVTIEELPLEPIGVLLDELLVDEVCAATATPGHQGGVTPPPTDALTGPAGGGGPGWLAVVTLLALVSSCTLLATPRRARRA